MEHKGISNEKETEYGVPISSGIHREDGVELSFAKVHALFQETDYGNSLEGRSRYHRYRPDYIPDLDWKRLLGNDVDQLRHMPLMYGLTRTFLAECRQNHDPTEEDAFFTEEEERLLLLTSITHDWGASTSGDITFDHKSATQETKKQKVLESVFIDLFGDNYAGTAYNVMRVMKGEQDKLSPAFDAIERVTRVRTALAAYNQSRNTDITDPGLEQNLHWLAANVFSNNITQLVEYADTYAPIQTFINQNQEIITEIFGNVDDDVFEMDEYTDAKNRKDFKIAHDVWANHIDDERNYSLHVTAPKGRGNHNTNGGLEHEAKVIAENDIRYVESLSFNELTERLRHITFRGVYDNSGNEIQPYANAKFTMAEVCPAASSHQNPTIKSGNGNESLFSPQPTIYENQTQIIRTVSHFLQNQGFSINELTEAISYDWRGRGRFAIMPPVVERQSFDFENGFIDLSSLSEAFQGCFVRDANGRLHELGARYLENYYVDEVSAVQSLDIFNPNLSNLNYGAQYEGESRMNIICDGAHRIDYALEHLREPISVILVEPYDNESPLIPYYALPTTPTPKITLSSKQEEKLYPNLAYDKVHLLNDILRKTLHYDWSATGLNVSTLRDRSGVY